MLAILFSFQFLKVGTVTSLKLTKEERIRAKMHKNIDKKSEDSLPFLKKVFIMCVTVGHIKGLQYALSGLEHCSV